MLFLKQRSEATSTIRQSKFVIRHSKGGDFKTSNDLNLMVS